MDNSDQAREIQDLAAQLLAWDGDRLRWPSDNRISASENADVLESALDRLGLDGPPRVKEQAERLALLLLLTRQESAVMSLLRDAARDSYRRFEKVLAPYFDERDVLSNLRWRLWERPPSVSSPWGFRTYVRLVARALCVDEARAIGRHAPAPTGDEHALDDLVDRSVLAEERLDIERLIGELRSLARTVPDGELLLAVLADTLGQQEALVEINRRRSSRGESEWTAEGLRSALHRLRRSLRSLGASRQG